MVSPSVAVLPVARPPQVLGVTGFTVFPAVVGLEALVGINRFDAQATGDTKATP